MVLGIVDGLLIKSKQIIGGIKMGKTYRREQTIKASDVKVRDDLSGLRRGHAHVLKTKYTRKKKHKERLDVGS